MNYGSICSGVEVATLAWEPLGWKAVFFAEVEPFPAAVLQQRFGATRPLRPLQPEDAENEKDAKTRVSWQKQIAELPEGGTIPNLGDFPKIRKGKPEEECPDAPRYKACGNSMCVNVMAWIGHRIDAVEKENVARGLNPAAP